MKHIFLTTSRRAEWLQAQASGDPTAEAVVSHIGNANKANRSEDPTNPNQYPMRFDGPLMDIVAAWIKDDAEGAENAAARTIELLNEDAKSDLGKASNILAAVLAWDFGNGLWEEKTRQQFASCLAGSTRSILTVTEGNPHTVTNNWWMLTHGACLLGCIAVDGEEGVDGLIELSDLKTWSLERFKAFCQVFGNAGLYHEGSGYIAYTLSMLMPALCAIHRHLDPGILDQFPNLRMSITSMLVGTVPDRFHDNGSDKESYGAALQWNDAGRKCLSLNPFIPGMAIAPVGLKGGLRSWFDRLIGVGGANNWECPYKGLPLTVALYPFDVSSEDPNAVLPKWTLDHRQGLGMWRSEWGFGGESVLGFYAKSTHAGGHVQDDAASIRLMALGRTWICSGGQARNKAEWQSVFTHADMKDRPKPPPLAHITSCRLEEDSGIVGIDTRKSLVAYSERYLSWRSDLKNPLSLAIMDLLDDHVDPPRSWQWNLSFPRELQSEVHSDGSGLTLIDAARGKLHARFLIDRPSLLEIKEMPPSSRTYSNGVKMDYPGDLYLKASFPNCKKARILVAMVLQGPEATEAPSLLLDENAISIDGERWDDPFSPAILKSVKLAQSEPNRMTLPAG